MATKRKTVKAKKATRKAAPKFNLTKLMDRLAVVEAIATNLAEGFLRVPEMIMAASKRPVSAGPVVPGRVVYVGSEVSGAYRVGLIVATHGDDRINVVVFGANSAEASLFWSNGCVREREFNDGVLGFNRWCFPSEHEDAQKRLVNILKPEAPAQAPAQGTN